MVSEQRQRSSNGGKFSIKGPSVIDEGQDAIFGILLDQGLTTAETVMVTGANQVKARTTNANAKKSISFEVGAGGNKQFFLVTEGQSRVSANASKYAYPCAATVELVTKYDSGSIAFLRAT